VRRGPGDANARCEERCPNLWHKNGYCVIPVTQEHIENSMQRKFISLVAVDVQVIRFSRRGLRYCFLTPGGQAANPHAE
jgi:hypothetical protein